MRKFSDINPPIAGSGGNRPIQQLEGQYQKIFKTIAIFFLMLSAQGRYQMIFIPKPLNGRKKLIIPVALIVGSVVVSTL